MKQVLKADGTCIMVLPFKRKKRLFCLLFSIITITINHYNIIQIGGVLLADVFAFEMPGLVCSALDSYLYGVVTVLAVDGIYGSGQA